jgi:hypothetical protein
MYEQLAHRVEDYFRFSEFIKPADWVKDNIIMSGVIGAKMDKPDLNLTPYLIDPLNEWDFSGCIREVTVVAPEQTGKSATWNWGLTWSFKYKPCLSIVCYPSDDLAEEANHETLMPLMRNIPELAAELAVPRAKTKDHFYFSNVISYFMGSGSRVTSKSAKIRVGDELDDWERHEHQVDNLDDLRKRGRSFDESLLYDVCSPTEETAPIWQEFLKSSRGYWTMRCVNCNKLSMRSCDVHNLQFELTETAEEKTVITGSERLICPICKHEHVESDKRAMNLNGAYIHEVPELIGKHSGYQWGALASQWQSLSWNEIAKAQVLAGRSGNKKKQIYFDNSIKGLPFKQRKITGDRQEKIMAHCAPSLPDPATIEAVFMSIDTQDYGWKWEVRCFDVNSCRWQLAYGFCEYLELGDREREIINGKRQTAAEQSGEKYAPVVTLDEVLYHEFLGINIAMAIIDEGGHRKREVENFVERHRKLFSYKGDAHGRDRWRWSETQSKLILAHERDFKSDLLYYIYTQKNRENNYWFLLPEVKDEYIEELAAMQPDETKRDGHIFENYDHNSRVHDFFDTSKMYLVIEEVAIAILDPKHFRCKKAEILKLDKQADAVPAVSPVNKPSGSWMSGY